MSRSYAFPVLGSASLSASRTTIDDAVDSMLTNFIGAGDISGTALVDGAVWVDSTANLVRGRIAGASTTLGKWAANLGMLRIDGTNAMTGSLDCDGQDIILTADGNTKIENGTANSIRFVINTVETIVWGVAGGEFAFNETQADINLRWESDADANALFCDAGAASGAGRVGIKTGTPVSTLDVVGSLSHNVVATSSSPYTLLESDSYLEVTAGAGEFAVNLPAIVRGRRYHVKLVATGGGTCTITRAGSDTIEDEGTGAAGMVVTLTSVNSSVTLYGGSGTVWRIEDTKGTVGVA